MSDGSFALTGLASRGGLSNWVFFFFPDALVMVDVGIAPAVKAGMQAGAFSQLPVLGDAIMEGLTYGPKAGARQGLRDWSIQLRARAKNVVELKNDQIQAIHLRLRMLGHELFVTGADGGRKKFGFMNRKEAEPAVEPLRQRLGSRFELSKTPVFAFLERRARFLL